MSQVRYHPLGPLLAGEGSRAFLGLALEKESPPRPVVLVWAPPELARDPQLASQLERETQRAALLEHPNVLRVHGLVPLEAGLARITEFADGESLRRLLEVRPRIPPAFAALIVSDVAMGIHYAHLAGNDDGTPLVHGDLRPETVMVSFNGVCKVTGYGALTVAPRERNGRRVRNRRNYSAPEQLMGGREAVTTRTDVFLLGLLLHECLSGRMPFQDTPDADQATLTLQLPPLPSDVPRLFDEVVRTATAKRGYERYATALEFREAVVAAVEGRLPSAEAFSEFLSQLFPPDRDARATRRQMLESGLAEVARRASLTGIPAVQPAPTRPSSNTPAVSPARPISGSFPPIASLEATEDVEVALEVPFEEEDADAIDSVLEHTGRQARPGVARPLSREEPRPPSLGEEPRTPPLREEPRTPPLGEEPRTPPLGEETRPALAPEAPPAKPARVDDALVTPKRRSRLPLLAGALAAVAAAGGFFLWTEYPQAREDSPDTQVASAARNSSASPEVPSPAPPAPPEAGGPAQAAPGDAGAPPPPPGGMEAPAAPNTETPAVTTRLQLLVLPPVDVSLDGKPLGRTPLVVPLAPGPYTLELSNKTKGVRTTRAVTVRSQGTTTQRILLGKGTVRVRAPAGSRIFLNGRKAGPKLSLYEGEHQLVVTSGDARWEKSFRLEPRQRVTFDVAYEKP
jgi:serine/threonine-protein kinase